ncbi:hypothetical protein BKA62DRAFT_95698 [Auriculariales sp. MPI-PUGE-AT-0066]|nr:hypothetical protein BKA62DRAFT_95698 [Auriculariales sp. MPI-PUGE-AT-0066]
MSRPEWNVSLCFFFALMTPQLGVRRTFFSPRATPKFAFSPARKTHSSHNPNAPIVSSCPTLTPATCRVQPMSPLPRQPSFDPKRSALAFTQPSVSPFVLSLRRRVRLLLFVLNLTSDLSIFFFSSRATRKDPYLWSTPNLAYEENSTDISAVVLVGLRTVPPSCLRRRAVQSSTKMRSWRLSLSLRVPAPFEHEQNLDSFSRSLRRPMSFCLLAHSLDGCEWCSCAWRVVYTTTRCGVGGFLRLPLSLSQPSLHCSCVLRTNDL